MLVPKRIDQEEQFERERETDAKVLTAVICAELSLQKNICISDLTRRVRIGEVMINNAINRLEVEGLLEIDNRRDNCRFVLATEKGYEKAGVQRPMWMWRGNHANK
jgi:hypothetical protein